MGRTPEVIEKPEYSFTAQSIIEAYNYIARSRKYEQGIPLSLSITDIESYVNLYDPPVEIHIFVDAIMMIDDLFLNDASKKQN